MVSQPLNLNRESVSCALCGGTEAVVCFETRGAHHIAIWKNGTRFDVETPETIVKCRRCGLVYVNPRVVLDPNSATYSPEQQRAYFESTHAARARAYYRLLSQTRRWLGRAPHDLLDVGCGDGVLMDVARELGWRCTGTEVSASLVTQVRSRLGADAIDIRPFEQMRANEYDIIAMINVLEHVSDPIGMLHSIGRLLKPDGIVLVHVPNWGGLPARLYGARWHQIEPLEHLYYFTAQTLAAAFCQTGLAPIARFNLNVAGGVKDIVQRVLGRLGMYLDSGLGMVARRSDCE